MRRLLWETVQWGWMLSPFVFSLAYTMDLYRGHYDLIIFAGLGYMSYKVMSDIKKGA